MSDFLLVVACVLLVFIHYSWSLVLSVLGCWLLQGVTFYQQLLGKLQATYDFSLDIYVKSDVQKVHKSNSRLVRLALVSCQRTMICLGDLARYREQANRTSNYGQARRLATSFVSVVHHSDKV